MNPIQPSSALSAAPPRDHAVEHVARVMNHAWLALVLSLGERLGLHEALAAAPGAETAAQLAARAGCDERYVREWAWAMCAGGMVDHVDAPEPRFALRPGYELALTSRGGPGHWARITNQITALATLEDQLVEAFASGGGLPAEAYEGRIIEVLEAESGPIFSTVLIEEVLPMLGVTEVLERGGRVLDLGCGTGQALRILAERFPASTFVGIDQSPGSVRTAADRAEQAGLSNVEFECADLEDPQRPFGTVTGPFDLVMAANVAHDLADPAALFARVGDLLAVGGTFYLHELGFTDDMAANVADPHAVGVLAFGLFHCLPLAKRRPGIAPGGMWGRGSYERALAAAGFYDVTTARAASDPNNDTIVARR